MYVFVRLFICLLIALITSVLINNNRKNNKTKIKNKMFLVAVTSIILYLFLLFVPFENCVHTFKSAESSLKYSNFHTPNLTIDGDTTSLTIYKKDISSNDVLIIPKSDNGWKIGRGIDTKSIKFNSNKLYSVNICYYRNTDEHYIILTDWNDEITSLHDNKNSDFKELFQTNKAEKVKVYATYIGDLDSSYVLVVNNQEYEFILSDRNAQKYEMNLKD